MFAPPRRAELESRRKKYRRSFGRAAISNHLRGVLNETEELLEQEITRRETAPSPSEQHLEMQHETSIGQPAWRSFQRERTKHDCGLNPEFTIWQFANQHRERLRTRGARSRL